MFAENALLDVTRRHDVKKKKVIINQTRSTRRGGRNGRQGDGQNLQIRKLF